MPRRTKNQFIIQDFRSWSSENYIELDRVNLFLGTNSSGKSSILYAFDLLKQSYSGSNKISSLKPQGDENGVEVDLGHIAYQINSHAKSEKKEVAFGVRIFDCDRLAWYIATGMNSKRRYMPSSRRRLREKKYLERLTTTLESLIPLDFIVTYDQNGNLIRASIRSSPDILFQIILDHTQKGIRYKMNAQTNNKIWNDFVDWDSIMKGKVPESEESQILANQIRRFEESAKSAENEELTKELARVRSMLRESLDNDEASYEAPPFKRHNLAKTQDEFIKQMAGEKSVEEFERLGLGGFFQVQPRLGRFSRLDSSISDKRRDNTALAVMYQYIEPDACTPWDIMCGFEQLFVDFVSNFERVGPHRDRPDRMSIVNPSEKRTKIGARGENLVPIIYNAENREITQINKWMAKLDLGYSIKRKRRSQNRYNIFEWVLSDSGGSEVLLTDVGYGVGQVLPIILICVLTNGRNISIEQPELHLHPKLQANLADLFIWSAKTQRNTFFLETHSEHLVLRLQRRQREAQENELRGTQKSTDRDPSFIPPWIDVSQSVNIQVIETRGSPPRSLATSVGINSAGEFKDQWPGDFFPERYDEMVL